MIPAEAKRIVRQRSGDNCERCGGVAVDIHHRRPRGAGGTRDLTINQPANLVALCRACHSWCESNRVDATSAGWLVPRRSQLTPRETPIYRDGTWWLLAEEWILHPNAWEVPF